MLCGWARQPRRSSSCEQYIAGHVSLHVCSTLLCNMVRYKRTIQTPFVCVPCWHPSGALIYINERSYCMRGSLVNTPRKFWRCYRVWTPCSRRSPPAAAPWWSRLRRSSPRRGRCGRLPMSTRPPGCVSTAQRCSGRGSSSSRQVMAGRPDRPDMAGQAADWPRLTGAWRGLRSAGRGLSRLFLIVGAAAAVRTAARGAAATSK